jgi:hypothetical protein
MATYITAAMVLLTIVLVYAFVRPLKEPEEKERDVGI